MCAKSAVDWPVCGCALLSLTLAAGFAEAQSTHRYETHAADGSTEEEAASAQTSAPAPRPRAPRFIRVVNPGGTRAESNTSAGSFGENRVIGAGSLPGGKVAPGAPEKKSPADADAGAADKPSKSIDPNAWFEINQAVLPAMRADYRGFFKNCSPGEVRDWAGGKIHCGASMSLFTDPVGNAIMMSPAGSDPGAGIDFNGLALNNPFIAKQWAAQYGFQTVGEPHDPQKGYSAGAFEKKLFPTWSDSKVGQKMNDWIVETYNSLPVAGSMRWNGMTVIRAGGPGCLILLDSSGASHQMCISTDKAWQLGSDAFARQLAEKYWGQSRRN